MTVALHPIDKPLPILENMPFRLCNAHATFQCLMKLLLRKLICEKNSGVTYIDNMIVVGETLTNI